MATRKLRTVEPGITILEISGRLNVGSSLTKLETQVSQLIHMGSRKLILDFSRLDYIDSASIGMLTGVHKEMKEAGGQLRIAGAQGAVAKVLKLIHMEKIMPMDPDLTAAQKAFGG